MKRSQTVLIGAMMASAVAGFWTSASAADRPLTVVELFTSQGCSSCPPANANLIKLSKRSDILALSFAVTYWDYLGWKDIFGKPEFTDRQAVYEPALRQSGSYTPQMVINGSTTTVGNELKEVQQLVADASPLKGPSISLGKTGVTIGGGSAPKSTADVWLVRYDPNLVEVPVERGENAGTTLPHTHIVHMLKRLGGWSGTAVSYNLGSASDGLRTAILVQGEQGGSILAAATD